MLRRKLKALAKRFAMAGRRKANSEQKITIFIISSVMAIFLLVAFAFNPGVYIFLYKALFFIAVCCWTLESAGLHLILEEEGDTQNESSVQN